MAAPESFRPKEGGRNETVFPITTVAVETALTSIALGPAAAMDKEYAVITEQNPALKSFLVSQMSEYDDDSAAREFFEGALWSHKILRYNVSSRELPVLQDRTVNSLYNVATAEEPGRPFKKICANKLMNIFEEEPKLSSGLSEMVKYRSSNIDFYFGAYVVIGSFRKHEEIKKFNASMGIE